MRPLIRTPLLCVLAGAMALTACSEASSSADPPNANVSAELLDEVGQAVAVLLNDGTPASELTVVYAQRVTWPDGAIGCPEPDKVYTQALVEGYRIVVDTPEGEVVFHGADDGEPNRCDDPQPPVS